jgi:hypothetical protein
LSEILITAAKKIPETVILYNSGIILSFGTRPIINTKIKLRTNNIILCRSISSRVAKILIFTNFEKILMLKDI